MSDMNEILKSMAQRRSALSEIGKTNKNVVFEALSTAAIDHVQVAFDGEGDSGQIQGVAAYRDKSEVPIPQTFVRLKAVGWGTDSVTEEEQSLHEAIESLCYDLLEQEHGGWEINEGSFGDFILDVAARTVALVFNGRYSDVHTTTHTF